MTDEEILEYLKPEPAKSNTAPSIFVFGLVKAGSTLLNRLVRPVARASGLVDYSLHTKLRAIGCEFSHCPADAKALLSSPGYAYTGFRGFDHRFEIPEIASGQSVLLVRDPRDQITSLYFSVAYSHSPPGTANSELAAEQFQKGRDHARSVDIDSWVLEQCHAIKQQHEQMTAKLARIDHRLYRYEDVVFEKREWVNSMLDYLSLDVPSALIARVVERNDVVPDAENSDSHIRRVTPGDHKEKLTPATIAILNNEFSQILDRYGYTA